MLRNRSRRRYGAWLAGFFLLLSACTSGSADTTTSSSAPATTAVTTSSTTTTTTPLLANGPGLIFEGDNNETVEAFQFLMNCNGYGPLDVDGAFGPATRAVVEEVQSGLGREVTGAPDDATFAILSRGCAEDRRIEVGDEAGGVRIVVGNVAMDDPEIYFVRAAEGMRMSIVVTSDEGGAMVDVQAVDGGAIGPGPARAWAADVTETQDYIVEVSTTLPSLSFVARVVLGEPEIGDVAAAPDSTVILGDTEAAITSVCLDTTGNSSYVATTAAGHLIATTGTPGRYAIESGGVGAPVEFVFGDGSPGFVGFAVDFDIDLNGAVAGAGVVFPRDPDSASEPNELAFRFDRSAAPCDGAAGTAVILSATGLGVVEFGAGDDETLGFVRSALPGASPTVDSGRLTIDNQANEFGICRSGTTEIRVIQVDNLTVYFSNAASTFNTSGTLHFVAFTASDGVFPFVTDGGVGPGSTMGDVLAAHPDAVAADGIGSGIDVFISSPPGDDRWLRATASGAASASDLDATITAVSGGRFCDL